MNVINYLIGKPINIYILILITICIYIYIIKTWFDDLISGKNYVYLVVLIILMLLDVTSIFVFFVFKYNITDYFDNKNPEIISVRKRHSKRKLKNKINRSNKEDNPDIFVKEEFNKYNDDIKINATDNIVVNNKENNVNKEIISLFDENKIDNEIITFNL
jgi:hypothetical protein